MENPAKIVTREFLQRVLGAGILGFDIRSMGDDGFLSDTYRIKLTRDDNARPMSLILKISAVDPYSYDWANAMGYYRNEVNFYQQKDHIEIGKAPRCYFAAHEGRHSILLLEDLSETATIFEQSDVVTPQQLALIATSLAKMHATFWDARPDWACSYDYHGRWRGRIAPENVAKIGQAPFSDYVSPEVARQAALTLPALEALIQLASSTATTLCHGDYRLANFALGAIGELRLFDWQCCHYGNGLFDIAWFFVTSVSPEIRRNSLDTFLDTYRNGLADAGVELSDSEFVTSFSRAVSLLWTFLLGFPSFFQELDDPLSQVMFRNLSDMLLEFSPRA